MLRRLTISGISTPADSSSMFAGIPHRTPHDPRRSFATIAQRAGVDKYTVKDFGQWSVVSLAEKHYTGNVEQVLRTAMDRIAGTA